MMREIYNHKNDKREISFGLMLGLALGIVHEDDTWFILVGPFIWSRTKIKPKKKNTYKKKK